MFFDIFSMVAMKVYQFLDSNSLIVFSLLELTSSSEDLLIA